MLMGVRGGGGGGGWVGGGGWGGLAGMEMEEVLFDGWGGWRVDGWW